MYGEGDTHERSDFTLPTSKLWWSTKLTLATFQDLSRLSEKLFKMHESRSPSAYSKREAHNTADKNIYDLLPDAESC